MQTIEQLAESFESGVAQVVATCFANAMRRKDYKEAKKCLREELGKATPEELDGLVQHFRRKFYSCPDIRVTPIMDKDSIIMNPDRRYLVRVGDAIFVSSPVLIRRDMFFHFAGEFFKKTEVDQIMEIEDVK